MRKDGSRSVGFTAARARTDAQNVVLTSQEWEMTIAHVGIRELDTDFVGDGMLNGVPKHGSPGKEEDRRL